MKIFSIEDIRSWKPCYDPSRYLTSDWKGTVIDLLNRKDIPFNDRLWCIFRQELVSDKLKRLFAVWCARQVQHLMKDQRSVKALDISELFAQGKVTKSELSSAAAAAAAAYAAADAAYAAYAAAAADAARAAAAAAAAYAAAYAAAAADAARAAAYAARAAAYAARAAAYAAQEARLREMLIEGERTGDTL